MIRACLIVATALAVGLIAAQPPKPDEQTAVQIEALNRLKGVDLESNAALKSAVLRVLEKTRGTPEFVTIVRDFKLKGHGPALLEYAVQYPSEASAVEAFRIAMDEDGAGRIPDLLDSKHAVAAVQLMGHSKDKKLQRILEDIISDPAKSLPLRKAAVQTLARNQDGARFLLGLATEEKMPADVKLTAAAELNLAPWPEIKKSAFDLLPLPQTKTAEPLPPVNQLIQRTGNAKRGREIFERQTTACSACHVVNGKGTDVGPQLSEIGTKLGKEALYESILDPSSGISFGFEAWNIETQNGDELFGLIISETPDELTVKSQVGLSTKVKKSEISRRQKLSSSLMPAGLQLTLSTEELVDLVEFLFSLKKTEPAR